MRSAFVRMGTFSSGWQTDRDGSISYNAGLIMNKLQAMAAQEEVSGHGRVTRMRMSEMEQTDRIDQLISALRDENEALRDHAAASLGKWAWMPCRN